ncbi:MAG: hypothetical protein PHN94_10015, partial [Bacteroidales bacterium]|nr:hypothetical protein [Bacteroidales bacterium]
MMPPRWGYDFLFVTFIVKALRADDVAPLGLGFTGVLNPAHYSSLITHRSPLIAHYSPLTAHYSPL